MKVAAIDPGCRHSALVVYDAERSRVLMHLKAENIEIRDRLVFPEGLEADVLLIEQMQNYGKVVGAEVMDAIYWSGRFAEAWIGSTFNASVERVFRGTVRSHFGASKGGDPVVRQALINRFGPYKADAIGTKKAPGPLYGVKADEWAALAIAVCWSDLHVPRAATA